MLMHSRSQIDAILDEVINRVSLESVEALSAKHRRERQSAGFSVEEPFDQLPDHLKEEILCRLPLRSVLRSGCVCKGWLSLTTSPPFLQLLERHNNLLKKDHPVGLLIRGTLAYSDEWFVVCSGVPKSKCFRYSLEFLPRLPQHIIVFKGSCDDLLLCCSEEWVDKDYFLMNSVTREWSALPPILRSCSSVLTGLVCDPTSIPEAKKGGNLRLRVVRILNPGKSETELNVEIFSSEDGQWNEYVMRCDAGREMQFCCEKAVPCNGSLYWKFQRGGKIVALDPFNPMKKEVVLIESPPDSFDINLRAEHLGIHGGKLRMCHTQRSVDRLYKPSGLHIWELEEGEGGAKWRSVKVASLAAIVAANPSNVHLGRSFYGSVAANPSYVYPRRPRSIYRYWITLALHPIDGDIIYFGCTWRNVIISCNLKTNRLKYVCDYNVHEWIINFIGVIPIVMPWCPTPVPAMPKL